LSHRYGSIGLPTLIDQHEYDLFKIEMANQSDILNLDFKYPNSMNEDESNEDVDDAPIKLNVPNLFQYSYELDENEKPPRYKLKSLDKLIPGFNQKVEKYFILNKKSLSAQTIRFSFIFKNPIFANIWSRMEIQLANLLKQTAKCCLDKNLIEKSKYDQYFVSGI
jgi:hypothetical protein